MIRKCLFPVAGYGTRFLPVTKAMAKEMLPIVHKPLVQWGVEEALDAGLKQVAFVTGRNKRAIADHFDNNYELEAEIAGSAKEKYLHSIRKLQDECTFSFTRQRSMEGLGHAILTGETLIGNEPFGVVLSDDLCLVEPGCDGVMQQMVKLYNQFRCSIVAVMEVPKEEISAYGVVDGEPMKSGLFRINKMVEKPDPDDAPSNLAIIGRYILTPDIFDIIRNTPRGRNNEIQLTDALNAQAKDGCVLAYQFKGTRFDCGNVHGFVEATNHVYENIYKPGLGV
jgi:UTP--glucose-1-phosphate uridylyltransferase|tara:strand:+ start:11299 stop:12141 length:843 start_codon:yes stop_codon:yes gene_type:complete